MAKDVPNKTVSSNNNSGNNSPSQSDLQKVPPLRIVLHTSGNQKNQSTTTAATTSTTTTPTITNSTTTAAPNQQQQQSQPQPQPQPQPSDHKREKPPDNNGGGGGIKTGGRVRIRLGTNRQQAGAKCGTNETNSTNKTVNESVKGESGLFKEEINASFGHLRRITRRSHRSVQAVSNEDEESISSMTSTDENQNATATTTASTTTVASTTTTTSTSTSSSASENATSSQDATTSSSSSNNQSSSATVETPRRYKRRKVDISEGLLNEQYGAFGFQNYMVPVQNSFELFKNIRKQVDKKLDTLSNVHPKSPRGFRDYMLARGSYLLHGNRLGNGTNLYMNEDGGLNAMPMSKFRALKQSRFYYSVPNRAKVPLGLPINSPLYDLFIEQEKERYRMRMQHIKEREKLTLAAEQEIMRVYNQAALAAADQPEPFSACTMLKHQEIYNYMDSDGLMIQSSEEDQQDQQAKQDGVRTRRRQHEQIAPSPGRKNSNNDQTNEVKEQSRQQASASDQTTASSNDAKTPTTEENEKGKKRSAEIDSNDSESKDEVKVKEEKESEVPKEGDDMEADVKEGLLSKADDKTKEVVSNTDKQTLSTSSVGVDKKANDEDTTTTTKEDNQSDNDKKSCNQGGGKLVADMEVGVKKKDVSKANETSLAPADLAAATAGANESDPPAAATTDQQTDEGEDAGEAKQEAGSGDGSGSNSSDEPALSDDIRRAYNKRIFLSQLQQIDDKWDKIRGEMLIRHRNEAESLHAVQKLEWEWKTKEIGACDVRTTPVIDNTLVPKLSIYSQDY